VKKLNVTPEDNDTSKDLIDECCRQARRAYIANEVANHKAVNSALETTLIPSASNAELKSLLQTGLKIFQRHQQHAEHVAAELKQEARVFFTRTVSTSLENAVNSTNIQSEKKI
jgi:putative membrane protein